MRNNASSAPHFPRAVEALPAEERETFDLLYAARTSPGEGQDGPQRALRRALLFISRHRMCQVCAEFTRPRAVKVARRESMASKTGRRFNASGEAPAVKYDVSSTSGTGDLRGR
jgi:hypothetical protein